MPAAPYVPHIDLLLNAIRISRARLNSGSKIAIDAKLLRVLLREVAAGAPFSAEHYLASNPDIAEAHALGEIVDLHRHYSDTGFFEGRAGSPCPVDERYYAGRYPDVAKAIANADIVSGSEHYARSGAAEGRVPSAQLKPHVDSWMDVLRQDDRTNA